MATLPAGKAASFLFVYLSLLTYSWRTVMHQNVLDGVFPVFLKRAEA